MQHAISKQAETDVIIIAACGERCQWKLSFVEFPVGWKIRTGRKLIWDNVWPVLCVCVVLLLLCVARVEPMRPIYQPFRNTTVLIGLGAVLTIIGHSLRVGLGTPAEWVTGVWKGRSGMRFPMDASAIVPASTAITGYVYISKRRNRFLSPLSKDNVSPIGGGNLKEPVTEKLHTKKAATLFLCTRTVRRPQTLSGCKIRLIVIPKYISILDLRNIFQNAFRPTDSGK